MTPPECVSGGALHEWRRGNAARPASGHQWPEHGQWSDCSSLIYTPEPSQKAWVSPLGTSSEHVSSAPKRYGRQWYWISVGARRSSHRDPDHPDSPRRPFSPQTEFRGDRERTVALRSTQVHMLMMEALRLRSRRGNRTCAAGRP